MHTRFPDVSLLITHYNRSQSLERLLIAFLKLDCTFADIVVSDDGSKVEHQTMLRELQQQYGFTLVTTSTNRGLGNNINKGQDAVKTPYTLYIQEDFVPKPAFVERLEQSLGYMEKDQGLDYVRFYAYLTYPYLKPYGDGFSETKFSGWKPDYYKIYAYSDHPHLRRSTFLTKFGRYVEGMKVDKTEYRMCVSFLQNKGRALFYNDFKELFDQRNDVAEPSTVQRSRWMLSHNPFIKIVRNTYRQVKYNYDIQFMRPLSK
ncbi:glycosyltransferase [Spirosoma sp. KUDC1026]|uniref:glycosyltransferase n=1 Tax=Spirosoma sp. KUDC1026 TaxID=2745947 RepID=UPI00159B8671|nr:glycosyltransferase [Spirosoma sp. KUDC1026]QKZ14638.1 glycosyltransferase [Spirosoma sp. KUDC1026]